jgi:hypothetical protein
VDEITADEIPAGQLSLRPGSLAGIVVDEYYSVRKSQIPSRIFQSAC